MYVMKGRGVDTVLPTDPQDTKPAGMHRVLIVDDEPAICDVMSEALAHCFDVTTAPGGREALRLCEQQHFDIVVSDINMPEMNGIELLSAIRSQWPSVVTVLLTGYNVNTYLSEALQHGIANIITKTAPFNLAEIEAELTALATGSIFGLLRYLLPQAEIIQRYEVRSSEQARQVRRQVSQLFQERFGTARDVELVVDEIVSNAVYHAPANPDGTPKYPDLVEVALEAEDYIQVECGVDAEKYGVSVTDNSGRLTKETVLERIQRHVTGQGLTDRRGRGIHISRMLSDRMIVNIRRGVKTEVILLNYFEAKYRGFKPLYINEI